MKGLFYGIGHQPNSQLVAGQIDLDDHGYVKVLAYVNHALLAIVQLRQMILLLCTVAVACEPVLTSVLPRTGAFEQSLIPRLQ